MVKEFNNLSNLFSYLQSKDINENILVALRYLLAKHFYGKSVINGKMVSQIFDNIGFAKCFMKLRTSNLNAVWVSRNYLVLKFRFERKSWYSSGSNYHYYTVGVNSETSKLWIEKTGLDITDYETEYTEPIALSINGKNLDLILTVDKDIQRYCLHYFYDLDLDGLGNYFLTQGNIVRVQGDILMSINRVGDRAVYGYLNELERAIAERLREILLNRVSRKIVDILQSYGLNVINERTRILVPCIRSNESKKGIWKRIYTVAKLVYDKLDLEKELKELHLHSFSHRLAFETKRGYWRVRKVLAITYRWINYDIIEITFDYAGTRAFGVESYDSVEIRINVDRVCCFEKSASIVRKLRKEWALGYVETKIRVGRHLIKAYARPLALNFELELFGDKHFIRVDGLPLVVYDKIEFIHPEHLKKTLTIPVPMEVAFTTIPEDRGFHERVNKYIMDYLVEKYGKDFDLEEEDDEESEI